MPPPPVTPSPHRFLSKPEHKRLDQRAREPPKPKPKSALRHNAFPTPDANTQKHVPKFDPLTAATPASKSVSKGPQFAATPRFGHARPPSPKRLRRLEPQREREADVERFATPRRFASEHVDVPIEDENGSHENDEEAFNLWDHDEPAPHAAARPTFLPAHHLPAQQTSTSLPSEEGIEPPSPLPHRPIFLAPSSPQRAHTTPLPTIFSPHRRGQKFVAGGMAAEVRQWVLDTSHVTGQSRRRTDEWRIKVTEVREGGGMVLVRGFVDGNEARVCLPSAHGREGNVSVGGIVVVKGVWWDVEIGREVWTVAVEWKFVDEIG